MICSQMGFLICNVILIRMMAPAFLTVGLNGPVANIISSSSTGQMVWAAIFCFTIIFPLSLSRKISNIVYTNVLGFIFGLYFMAGIVMMCFFKKDLMANQNQV